MFDDKPTNNIPSNLPVEPDDIFAAVDDGKPAVPKVPDALSAGLLQKKTAPSSPAPEAVTMPVDIPPAIEGNATSPILGKILLFILLALVLGALGFGGWWLYAFYLAKVPVQNTGYTPPPAQVIPRETVTPPASQPEVVAPPSSTVETVTTTPIIPTTSSATQIKNDQILFGSTIDTDKDGLPDIQERQLGTDPRNPDTDGDGLSDGDEVNIWHTNPLNSDTDGDGYSDGVEVKNGYNPLGPGRLVNVPSSTAKATTTR